MQFNDTSHIYGELVQQAIDGMLTIEEAAFRIVRLLAGRVEIPVEAKTAMIRLVEFDAECREG
jgi:hypothetical protein